MTDDTPNDARLPRDYDAFEQLNAQQAELELEERRVTASPIVDDPGEDHVVAPPVIDDDDVGFDPTPPPSVHE